MTTIHTDEKALHAGAEGFSVTLQPVAEIATGSREHPKLWPTKQILQRESHGSHYLSLLPAINCLKCC